MKRRGLPLAAVVASPLLLPAAPAGAQDEPPGASQASATMAVLALVQPSCVVGIGDGVSLQVNCGGGAAAPVEPRVERSRTGATGPGLLIINF